MIKIIVLSSLILSAIPAKIEIDLSRYHVVNCLMISGDVEKHVFEYDIDDKPENICREINGMEM